MRKFTYVVVLGFVMAITGCEKESVADQPKASAIKTDPNAPQQNGSGCGHDGNYHPPSIPE